MKERVRKLAEQFPTRCPATLLEISPASTITVGNRLAADFTSCRLLFGRIISGTAPPTYLSSDNDPLFEFHRWKANLRILEIEEIKTVPYVPISHPFVERLIGTIRREYLDHVPFWNAQDLERKLCCFQDYYNRERPHQGIGGAIPDPKLDRGDETFARLDDCCWKSCCRGLYQLPIAA